MTTVSSRHRSGWIIFYHLHTSFKLCDILALDNIRRSNYIEFRNALKNKPAVIPQGAPSQICTAWWLPDTSSFPRSRPKAWQRHRGWSSSPQSMLVSLCIPQRNCRFYVESNWTPSDKTPSLSFDRATTPSKKPAQLWVLGLKTSSCWTLMTGFLFELLTGELPCRRTHPEWRFVHCYLLFFRGRVIPADLEAKVIQAKQKVTHRNSSTATLLN